MTITRNARRTLYGVVKSTKSAQTITIEVERTYRHPKYGKYVRKRKKYLVHDANEEAKVGDKVEVVATRPISKRKRWRLVRVLGIGEITEATLAENPEILARFEASQAEAGSSGATEAGATRDEEEPGR